MKQPIIRSFVCAVACIVMLLAARAGSAQETLAAARDLYSAAAYDEALAALDRLKASGGPADESHAINEYRVFCLLALGRTAEADKAIEAFVSAEPLYHPSEAEASPRVRAAFTTVRQRMLPAIVQQKYAQAKAAFDRQEFDAAAAAFGQVLDALDDSDLGAAAGQPLLSDLRTLAAGFRDLSVRSSAPPPPAPPAAPPAAMKPEPALPAAPRIYTFSDAGVTPPVTVRQELPPFPQGFIPTGQGVLEIVINQAGDVETAAIRSPMNARYDQMAIASTRTWKYRPAVFAGAPVKFRKLITISIKAGS